MKPALKKRKKPVRKLGRKQRKQLALFTVILLIASIVAIMLLTPIFDVTEIRVYGNTVVKTEDIIARSQITKGVNIFDVNISNAKDNILSIGYIENVKIKRKLPSTIEITVVEEVGVACIRAEDGFAVITADGKCIDIVGGGNDGNTVEMLNMPVVTGLGKVKYKVGSVITAEDDKKLPVLYSCLREFTKQGYVLQMKEIDMSDMNSIKFYYLTRDLCVSVGDGSRIDYKMECFGPIMVEIGADAKGYIDLERLTYRPPQVKTQE